MKKTVLKIIIFIIIINIITIILPGTTFAVSPGSDQGLGCGGGFGAIADILCQNSSKANVGITLNKVISTLIGFMTIVAAIWFIFQFLTAAYQWIGSGGDKNEVGAARDKITWSLIGLMAIVIAWSIVGIIGKLLGLDILNPGAVLQTLGL